jgi:hypothetical protein
MKTRTLLASLTTAAAIVGASAGSAGAATSAASESVSQNWAGYVVGGSDSSTQFSNVSGSWVQPTSKCSSGQDDAAYWVGIGGADSQSSSGSSLGDGSSTSLEQIGTEGNCTGNGTAYYAWYELVPAAPVQLNLAIHPGDHITASVNVSGNNTSFSLTDKTTGQSFSKTVSSPNPDTSSAEWIAEAPSQCDGSGNCTPLPLSDFGTVDFTGASATANGHTGPISDPNWTDQAVALGSGGTEYVGYGSSQNAAGATPSSLSSDGSSFSVAWSQNGAGSTSTSSPTSGSTGGYGDGGYGGGGYGYGGYPGGDGSYGYGAGGGGSYGYGGGYGGYGYGGYGGGYGYGYGSF